MSLPAMPSVAQTVSLAWHMLQRLMTISCTTANDGVACDAAGALGCRGPSEEREAITPMPIAVTIQTHHGLPLPACRELKKCRMTGPNASTIAIINQLK